MKKSIRIISMLLSICMMISVLSTVAFAESNTTNLSVSTDHENYHTGDIITATVSISSMKVSSFVGFVLFDSSLVEYIADPASLTPSVAPNSGSLSSADGIVRLSVEKSNEISSVGFYLAAGEEVTYTGGSVVLHFRAKAEGKPLFAAFENSDGTDGFIWSNHITATDIEGIPAEQIKQYLAYAEVNIGHIYSQNWSNDGTRHWHECTCGDKIDVENHSYDNACDTTCNECGAVRTVGPHVYDNACDTICNVCGAVRTVGPHVYDNACDTTCNECGATRSITHSYQNTWSKDGLQHWHECSVCHDKTDLANHRYDNACDTTCNDCGYIRTVGPHVYDNACDTTCNECGAKRALVYNAVSLTLSSDIYLNFYAQVTPEAAQGGKMVFEIGSRSVEVTAEQDENGFFFACPVNALEMAVPVNAKFTYNDVTTESTFSVKQYIDAILAGSYDATIKSLVRKIANYGYYTQLYLEEIHGNVIIGTGSGKYPAMEHFSECDINVAAVKENLTDTYVSPLAPTGSHVQPYGRTVLFDSTMAINFYVTVDNDTEPTAVCAQKSVAITKAGEQYMVTILGIKTSELATRFTVKINGVDFTCSVFDYCAALIDQNGIDSTAARSVAALYEYYTAAQTYAESK